MGIFVDILLFLFFTKIGGRADGGRSERENCRGNDVFIPFEDMPREQQRNTAHQDKTDYYPEDFSDFGEF